MCTDSKKLLFDISVDLRPDGESSCGHPSGSMRLEKDALRLRLHKRASASSRPPSAAMPTMSYLDLYFDQYVILFPSAPGWVSGRLPSFRRLTRNPSGFRTRMGAALLKPWFCLLRCKANSNFRGRAWPGHGPIIRSSCDLPCHACDR